MAFWNIVGGTANTSFDSNGFATGTDIDQGSIRHAGNISETNKFTDVTLGEGNPVITIASGVGWIDPANGSSARFNGGTQVIVRVTDTIAALSNTTLLGGDSNSAENPPIHQIDVIETKLYKTAVRNGQWNPVNGAFSPAVSVVESGGWNISAGVDNSNDLIGSGTDDAANPTQEVPGELVYNYGSGSDPTQDEYEARTNW